MDEIALRRIAARQARCRRRSWARHRFFCMPSMASERLTQFLEPRTTKGLSLRASRDARGAGIGEHCCNATRRHVQRSAAVWLNKTCLVETSIMDSCSINTGSLERPPAEYLTAMAELERRAWRGELTLGQVRQEISVLRERLGIQAAHVMRWAAYGR